MYLAEKLQNGDTLAEAWMKGNWESKWAFSHHTAYSLQGSGADKPLSKADKKGKKRGLEEGMDEVTGGTGWQSKYDSLRIQNAKLQKLVDGKGKNKSKNKNAWNGHGGGGWGGIYNGSWNAG